MAASGCGPIPAGGSKEILRGHCLIQLIVIKPQRGTKHGVVPAGNAEVRHIEMNPALGRGAHLEKKVTCQEERKNGNKTV